MITPKTVSSLLKSAQTEAELYQDLANFLGEELTARQAGIFVIRHRPQGKHLKHGATWHIQDKTNYVSNTLWEQADLGIFTNLKEKIDFSKDSFVSLPQQKIYGYHCNIFFFAFEMDLCDTQKKLLQLLCQTIATTVPLWSQLGKLQQSNNFAEEVISSRSNLLHSYSDIVGDSDSILKILKYLDKIIEYSDSNDNIYIQGETGTGKSLVAKSIHKYSKRHKQPFVHVNCGSLVESICEMEFFGVAANSGISGAPPKGRPGLFELANNGIIFLDEISELSRQMQAALLLVIEGCPFRRVCGLEDISVNIRIIAASTRDIKLLSKEIFMPELAERLDGIRLNVPSLRDRREDIIHLFDHFFNELSPERQSNIDNDLKTLLLDYNWPGNIRQLQNCIRQCSLGFVPDYLKSITINKQTKSTEKKVKDLLHENNKLSMKEVAQAIGISRFALRRELKSQGKEWRDLKREYQ
ncbi:sigma 54-interacting transcriptional regulator [Candidatus Uabimicrobium sp. HlEnr_7]|uniref:sigma 54-interacting transcriptional regulator n=1 Tax=Candidatus Uabimicrobium helgolandensis TaxID=3095367 RepID=UPI00355774FF